jgi:phenylalanine-4-hydroxylase
VDGLRIVGAGIASSPAESVFALDSSSPNRVAFELGRVMRTRYRIDDFQESYFVLADANAWPALDMERLPALWRELAPLPDFEPGTLLPGDRVLTRGDGSHHRAKPAA